MTDSELCQLAGLIRLKPYPERLLVGETPKMAVQLLNIFSAKHPDFVIILFSKKRAYVKGCGLHFSISIENRDFFLEEMKKKRKKLGNSKIGTDWNPKLWEVFFDSQEISQREHSNPRWSMPKKWNKKLGLSFESGRISGRKERKLPFFL